MYLGDAVVVGIVAVTVVLEVDTRVCCGGGNARSSNDGFRISRRLEECEAVEEAPNEKESTTLPNVKQKKNRAICVQAIIRRRRKGEQCTRRIAIIIIITIVA
jgi:hypothetical protein